MDAREFCLAPVKVPFNANVRPPEVLMSAVVVDPPVRGEWAILNPPGHPKRAFDFLAVRDRRNPYKKGASLLRHLFSRISVENTLAWDMPVYVVLPGTVIAASDGTPDRVRLSMALDLLKLLFFGPPVRPPFSQLGGNHVILDCGGVFPLYAHLRCGSIVVREGQKVTAGELLGYIGNSGASLQPHLHFQVMNSPDPLPLFKNLLPIALSTVQLKQDEQWQSEANHQPRNGDHYLFGESVT